MGVSVVKVRVPVSGSYVRRIAPPTTGDEANFGLWIAGMAVSATALAVLFLSQRKRKNRA